MIRPNTKETMVQPIATVEHSRRNAGGKLAVICLVMGLALLLGNHPATAADAAKNTPPVPKMRQLDLTPLPESAHPVSAHSPFSDGDCSICHQRKDPSDPGAITKSVNALCLDCHDDFTKLMAKKYVHVAAQVNCVSCHNPHNSKYPKLLVADSTQLCLGCHTSISNLVTNAKVKHDAMTMKNGCANCHNPHAANVEHLLNRLPYDLCVSCHGADGVADHDGKKLTNMKQLLADNPHQHGPVADKDCSACHLPHGSDNFRLLTKAYPAQFYSPYDPKLYDLCFDCHDEAMVKEPKTTKLTKFRNGDENLHYLHVNKDERGRTCRACHEIHASKQAHQIRDAVPYGNSGYLLKINFTQTATGGECARTCHVTRSYTNTVVSATAPAAKPEGASNP